MQSGWNGDEVKKLKKLRLDTVKNSPEKLVTLVRYFKGPGATVWAVTAGAGPIHVSSVLARKVRDSTQTGELDWLLHRGIGGKTEKMAGVAELSLGHEGNHADPNQTGNEPSWRKALEDHREDVTAMLRHLHDAIHTPSLEFRAHPIDFGLEELLEPGNKARKRSVPLGHVTAGSGFRSADPGGAVVGQEYGPADVEVIVIDGSPNKVRFPWDSRIVGDAFQQHFQDDALLIAVAEWKDALIADCRARGELNIAVKSIAEEVFHAPLTPAGPPGEARLTPALVWLVREELTRRGLGIGASDLLERVTETGGDLSDHRTGTYLASGFTEGSKAKDRLKQVVDGLTESPEAQAAAKTYQGLDSATRKARNAAEAHLLRHQIPGKCESCPAAS